MLALANMDPISFGEEEILGEITTFIEPADATIVRRKRRKDDAFEDTTSEAAKKQKLEQAKLAGEFVQAARNGAFETMKDLVSKGADINEKVVGCTALMYAAFYGRDEMAEYLLKQGASVDEENLSGQTALAWAVERGHKNIVRTLIRNGNANVNLADKKGLSPLHKAVKAGDLEMVRILVEDGGANVNLEASKEFECSSVLQDAAFYGKLEIVQLLLENGANVDQRNSQGRTALHRAVYKNYIAIARQLIDCGADVNALDTHNKTALHWAAFFGRLDIVKLLVESGTNPLLKDKTGLTALDIATNKKHVEVVDFISQWIQSDPDAYLN